MGYRIHPHMKGGEDWDYEYGKIDYTGKIVLDVGAEYGSTADFFLRRGARQVIAVEGSSRFIRNLIRNAKTLKNVISKPLWITKPEHFVELILKYRPDIAKVDCEGCEVHLFNVPDDIFSLIPEYVIETHSDALFEKMVEKCKENNYQIWHITPYVPHVDIVYAKRF